MVQKRRLRIRAARRKDIDLGKLSRALIDLAAAQAEADAQADHQVGPSASPATASPRRKRGRQ